MYHNTFSDRVLTSASVMYDALAGFNYNDEDMI
jgi:hypothetical protein